MTAYPLRLHSPDRITIHADRRTFDGARTACGVNAALRDNPTEMAARAAYADLCAATGTVDVPDMPGVRDQEADIKVWHSAADRAYNARVAPVRGAGTAGHSGVLATSYGGCVDHPARMGVGAAGGPDGG